MQNPPSPVNGRRKETELCYKLDIQMLETQPKPRRKLQVMSLTEAAATRVRDVIARSDKPIIGLRVGVKNGGCAGMAYTMDYAESLQPHDEVVEDKGVKVIIDPKAVMFLLGTQMDVKTDKFASTFVFNNPNQTSSCGCGESVAITPVKE
jgi:iron-sulfur cluster assembly protein